MVRKLYVHIGPTKTGTSALQNTLSRLDGSVILYPKAGQHDPHKSHHGLVMAFFKNSPEAAKHDAKSVFEQLASQVGSSKSDVVISSEWLMKRGAPKFIRHVLRVLGDDSWEVEVLFGCRDHFERAASAYSQIIKGPESSEQRDPDEYLRERIGPLLYRRMLRTVQEGGFKVTGLNYHPSTNWIKRFLMYVGIEGDIPEPETKNSSLSTKALIAQLCANRVLKHAQDRQMFWKALKQVPECYAPSQFIFGTSAAIEAELSFASDRAYLLDEFGVALSEPDLENRENRFFLEARDLAEISTAARQLGDSADALIDSATRYLRA